MGSGLIASVLALGAALETADPPPEPSPEVVPGPSEDISTLETVVDAWVRGQGRFPSLAAVQEAAEVALRLEPEHRARSWSDRARNRGWVPRLDVRVGTDSDRDVRALGRVEESWTEERAFAADVAARWSLGDIVFADVELRVNRERLARSAAVRLARERVTKVYFQRLEVELAMRVRREARLVLEAARLDGLLKALTGGAWGLGGADP